MVTDDPSRNNRSRNVPQIDFCGRREVAALQVCPRTLLKHRNGIPGYLSKQPFLQPSYLVQLQNYPRLRVMALCYDVLCQSSVTIAKKLVLEELLVVELVVDELLIDELLLVELLLLLLLVLLVLVELVVVPWLFNRRLQACIRFCQI